MVQIIDRTGARSCRPMGHASTLHSVSRILAQMPSATRVEDAMVESLVKRNLNTDFRKNS